MGGQIMTTKTMTHSRNLCRIRRIRARKQRRWKDTMAGLLFTIGLVVAFLALPQDAETTESKPLITETPIPYYMTEEYQQMKRQEQLEAEREGEALRKSIEEYNAAQEREAVRQFQEAHEQMIEDMTDGFIYYELPQEYTQEGGSFPEDIQRYTFKQCQKKGVDYPTIVAMIEQESAYQKDTEGDAGDIGYMQVVGKFHTERMERLGTTDLTDPKQNIKVGVDFMAELLEEYDGNYGKALTAYQYGRDGAYKYWFSAGVEANPYARKILRKAERIRKEMGLE